MKITKYMSFIPWVLIGQVIGTLVVIPLGYFLFDKFYYSTKYERDDAVMEVYRSYMQQSYVIKCKMPDENSKCYLENVDNDVVTHERFKVKSRSNYFDNPSAEYVPFYSMEHKKFFNIIFMGYFTTWGFYNKEVYLTVNKDDMYNPEYGTKDNPVPVLKMIGVDESIRDGDKDYDKAYMDSFYRKNVIRYLKYKMSKKEFERRFKNKGV